MSPRRGREPTFADIRTEVPGKLGADHDIRGADMRAAGDDLLLERDNRE